MRARTQPVATKATGPSGGARRASLAVVAGFAAAAVLACGPRGGRERFVVASVEAPATALFFVARDSGCLEREGLDVEERTFELGRDALALMRQDGADVAIAYETPALRAAFVDDRIRVLTALHTSTRNTRLVARGDRGVTGFDALAGARIGLAHGSNADFFLDLALRFGGVPRARVTIEDLSPQESVAALGRGDLDAAVLSDPWAARAEQLLGHGARVFQSDLYTEVSLLLTRDDVLRTREGALRKLVRGLACAERLARERPADALALVGPHFPEFGEADLRAQLDRVRWGLGLDLVVRGVLHDEGDWLRGFDPGVGAPPDLRRVIEPRVLEQVDPEAVMLLPDPRRAP